MVQSLDHKIFGKLSRPQVARVFKEQPQLARLMASLRRDLAKSEKASAWRRAHGDIVWANLYELPMEQVAAIWFVVAKEDRILKEAAESDDPQEAVLDWVESYEPSPAGDAATDEVIIVVASLIALVHVWAAVGWYSATMCELVDQARNGDDEAFFKAVSVDPSCLCGRTGAGRLSRAIVESDTKFVKRLGKALKGPNRLKHQYSRHRVAEFILRDAGAFKIRGNREEVFEAVTNDLGLAMKRDGDAFKAWTSRVSAWQKEATGKSTI